MSSENSLRERPVELQLAFSRFTEASAALAARYEVLRQEAEQLRAQLKEKDEIMRRQERLAMLGETAAAIAHEVRNPLGALKLFVSLLKDDVADRPGAIDLLSQMNRSLQSLENVVSNILQFSKKTPDAPCDAQFVPVNLHALIQEQLDTLVKGREGLAVQLDLTANPFVQGLEHSLRPLFYNLFLNAAQAMRYQGHIEVRTWDSSEGVCVSISDNGPGISPELLPRIFEPFVTSKNEGTGLGLAIVQQILEQHRGSIVVGNRSDGGQGACFTLKLPRQPGRMKVAA